MALTKDDIRHIRDLKKNYSGTGEGINAKYIELSRLKEELKMFVRYTELEEDWHLNNDKADEAYVYRQCRETLLLHFGEVLNDDSDKR